MSPTPTLIRVDVVVAPVNDGPSISGVAYVQVPPGYQGKLDLTQLGCMAMAREVFFGTSPSAQTAKDVPRDTAATMTSQYKSGRSGGVSIIEQIKTIMGRKTLGTQAILDALVKNGWQTNSEHPKRMILHILVTNSKGRNSTFKRAGRGQYMVR